MDERVWKAPHVQTCQVQHQPLLLTATIFGWGKLRPRLTSPVCLGQRPYGSRDASPRREPQPTGGTIATSSTTPSPTSSTRTPMSRCCTCSSWASGSRSRYSSGTTVAREVTRGREKCRGLAVAQRHIWCHREALPGTWGPPLQWGEFEMRLPPSTHTGSGPGDRKAGSRPLCGSAHSGTLIGRITVPSWEEPGLARSTQPPADDEKGHRAQSRDEGVYSGDLLGQVSRPRAVPFNFYIHLDFVFLLCFEY